MWVVVEQQVILNPEKAAHCPMLMILQQRLAITGRLLLGQRESLILITGRAVTLLFRLVLPLIAVQEVAIAVEQTLVPHLMVAIHPRVLMLAVVVLVGIVLSVEMVVLEVVCHQALLVHRQLAAVEAAEPVDIMIPAWTHFMPVAVAVESASLALVVMALEETQEAEEAEAEVVVVGQEEVLVRLVK